MKIFFIVSLKAHSVFEAKINLPLLSTNDWKNLSTSKEFSLTFCFFQLNLENKNNIKLIVQNPKKKEKLIKDHLRTSQE